MTSEQRKEVARKAANARWSKDMKALTSELKDRSAKLLKKNEATLARLEKKDKS